MQDVDALMTIAEVAVAFAGFASIVSVLGRRDGRDISRFHASSLRGMIFCSLAVVFCAFAPLVPLRFGLSPAATWQTASIFFLLVAAALLIAGLRDAQRLREAGVSRVLRMSGGAPIVTAVALSAIGATGWLPDAAPGLYLVALLVLLAAAGYLFAGTMLTFLARRSEE